MMRIDRESPTTAQIALLMVISTLAWSFGPICTRFALQSNVDPEFVGFGRVFVGMLVFTPFVWRKYRAEIRRMPIRALALAIASGALFGFNITLNAASLEHISVIIGQAFIATIPVWVAIMEVTVLKATLNRLMWLGVVLALTGGIAISLATSGGPAVIEGGIPALGVLFALVSASSASVYIIIGRSLRGSVALVPYIWVVYASGSVVCVLMLIFGRATVLSYDPPGYFWVLLLAILTQVFGHGVLNFVLKFISPTTITVVSQAVPILSAVWALLILREVPTILQGVGSAILIIGVGTVLHGQNRLKRPTS